MAGTGIALFIFVLAIFVCMAVGCIMWTKHIIKGIINK